MFLVDWLRFSEEGDRIGCRYAVHSRPDWGKPDVFQTAVWDVESGELRTPTGKDVLRAFERSSAPKDMRLQATLWKAIGGYKTSSTSVWGRRRPEWWWGVFWLWELWLTAAFGVMLSWSLWRDRRALGRRKA